MKNIYSFFLFFTISLLFLTILNSCTTTADKIRNHCRSIKVYEKGRLDVSQGKTSKGFEQELKRCSEYGVQLNKTKYIKGRKEELKLFCTPDKGYDLGLKGKKYLNICPKDQSVGFLKGYQKGDKKCLYKEGYARANEGKASVFPIPNCLKLAENESKKEYEKGWNDGIKVFCSYDKGYMFGQKAKPYLTICPKDQSVGFLKGYQKGDKKCLYEDGYSHAIKGQKTSFSLSNCLKLAKNQSQKAYIRGRRAGLKDFCTYKKGYEFGLNSQKYLYTCPKNRAAVFLKAYRAGDKKCLYEDGYNDGSNGKSSDFSSTLCLKLSKTHSQNRYKTGYNAGLKSFCTYKTGYNIGIKNGYYGNVCPKNLESIFFQGYTLGLQEYKAEQRQQELIRIEQQKIQVERERTQRMMEIEQQKIQAERERTQRMTEIEEQKIQAEREQTQRMTEIEERRVQLQEQSRKDFLNSQMQKCTTSYDCQEGGECKYNTNLKYYVCHYE